MKKHVLICGLGILLGFLLNTGVLAAANSSIGRWTICSKNPALQWEDAFVTGNGKIGSLIAGRPQEERITCVHEELFIRGWDRHKVTVPQTAQLMPYVRQLMEKGKSDEAAWLLTDEAERQLHAMGANQRWPLIPHPAFDLCIRQLDKLPLPVADYRRQLNLETGEATVVWKQGAGSFTESVFSSRKDNVNVIRLKANNKGKINVELSLEETPGREGEHFEHDLDHAFSEVNREASGHWLTYHAAYDKDPGGYDGVAKVTLRGGNIQTKGKSLVVRNAEEVLIIVSIVPQEDARNASLDAVKAGLDKLATNYDKLLRPHVQKHGELFHRMQLDLGCGEQWTVTPTEQMLAQIKETGPTPLFLEQLHAMGRYLLISSCGKFPPPLQGIWSGGWKPAWIGGFVWDSNLNLAISATTMSNLPECAESYNRHIESLLPGWRLNARNYLGCRGFVVAHYNDPTNGYLTHFGSSFPWMFWAGGAGWNLRPLYEYAMLTGNVTYLKEKVYPLYKEMADFYEDYLVEGTDGLYHITTSISPENAPKGTNTWLSKDATMDVAIAREVFTFLCDMGRRFHASSAEMERWNAILQKLPAYRINNDGALAEWVDPAYPDIYNHRHNSHLYPVFPGIDLVGPDADPALQKAAKVALDKRFGFDTSSAHGLIHLALQAARLGDADKVRQNIERFSKRNYLYDGLITSHEPGRAIFNLDAILSFPRLLMEMLVFTKSGYIEFLPAWPVGFPDGSLKGMRIYGGHTLDICWKAGRLESFTIHAVADETLEWAHDGMKECLELKKDKPFQWRRQAVGAQMQRRESMYDEQKDETFFAGKRNLLTAKWEEPFSYESIRSKHAPMGPFMGNGDVGCVSHTTANSQTIRISKVDFVTDGWEDWTGRGPAALPIGGIKVSVDAPSAEGFRYEMDMLGNELRMTSGTLPAVEMTSWMGRGSNVIVTELVTASEHPVTITVDTYAGGTTSNYEDKAMVKGTIAQAYRRTLTDSVRWISQAGVSTRIIGAVSSVKQDAENNVKSTFTLNAGEKVYVVTYVSGGGTEDNARLDEAYVRLTSLSVKDLRRLKQQKDLWWTEMWRRSYVETGDDLIDRQYLVSVYLQASAYDEHSPACGGMYGVWNMDDEMNYHGDIHLNYNSQGGFYSMFSSNRPELAMPYYRFLEEMIPEGRRRAKEELELVHPSLKGKSCRGLLFPVSALGIGGFYCTYWQQTVNAPFNVPLFSWYYEYTGDETFLRERAYPFIRECGNFYEDYIQKERYGNSYRYTITTGGHENSWDLNPPSDVAFVEQTFRLLLRYSQILNMDADRRDKWQDIVDHLPAYKVIMPTRQPNQGLPVYAKNEAGWDAPNHMIQLHAAYPCEVLNLASSPEALQIARNTVHYYFVAQEGYKLMNELGLSAYVMGARVAFDPEILIDKMRYQAETAGKNFLITDGHHCLEKSAIMEAVHSMMLQTVDDVLYLFPDWMKKPASFTRLRAKGGFLVSASYDGAQVTELKIQAGKAPVCKIRNPWPDREIEVTANGRTVPVTIYRDYCAFSVRENEVYHVVCK